MWHFLFPPVLLVETSYHLHCLKCLEPLPLLPILFGTNLTAPSHLWWGPLQQLHSLFYNPHFLPYPVAFRDCKPACAICLRKSLQRLPIFRINSTFLTKACEVELAPNNFPSKSPVTSLFHSSHIGCLPLIISNSFMPQGFWLSRFLSSSSYVLVSTLGFTSTFRFQLSYLFTFPGPIH